MVMTTSARAAASFALCATRAAGRLEPVGRRAGDVDALDLVAGLEQVLRHRQAHIAEPLRRDIDVR